MGINIHDLNLRFEDGFNLDIKALEKLITKRTKLVSLTYPHNRWDTSKKLIKGLNNILKAIEEAKS